ncbi:tRNA pseudouridine synthase A [bacterium]|nr:MAG: tRNA pseudouridine synthase A [bacterium]RIK61593.1 MAG: tRNA pseudouridine(38-40) synthase TruA [Planctomycetota bacterium]
MRRILLTVEFHGGGFFGWQRQGAARTVQSTLEEAVRDLVGHEAAVHSSGRTDRGVHALAMAAHVDLDSRLDPASIMMALNARLPQDCKVRRAQEVDPRFHARFDAHSKLYRYSFVLGRSPSPLLADRACHMPRPLDVMAMANAARFLVGPHDFACFESSSDEADDEDGPDITADRYGPAAVASGHSAPPPWRKPRPRGSLRHLMALEVRRVGRLVQIEASADGFLRGMVRSIAGTLTQVGLGRQVPDWVRHVLASRDRREAGANMPPEGLTLVRVVYPPEALKWAP